MSMIDARRESAGWPIAAALAALLVCAPPAFAAGQKDHPARPPQATGTTAPAPPTSTTAPAPAMGSMTTPMGMEPMGAMQQPMGSMQSGDMRSSEASLVRTLLPTVVNISSRKVFAEAGSDANAAAQGESGRVISLSGSGFIIDPTGIIATNYHVIDGAFEIIVTFFDGSRAPAKLMAATKIGDIAILKIDVSHPLPVVRWGDSEKIEIGDPVIAIGNPLGIGMSVSSGIVSALHRDIMASPFDDFIQTDAPINHGNSGGPLFNMKGEVIGIDTAIYSPTSGSVGIGFAIPSMSAEFVIGRLEKYGRVKPGWLGVNIQQVSPDIAEALGMAQPTGAILSEVTPGGPADKAGLKVGDVIMRVDDKPATDTRAVMRDIAKIPAGTDATIAVWHDGQLKDVTAKIEDWPSAPKLDNPLMPAGFQRAVPPDLGLQLTAFDDQARNKYGLDFDVPGVLVTGVARNTDAAERGIVAGDVILQVQDQPVSSPADVEREVKQARAAKRSLVLMLIRPNTQKMQAQTAAATGQQKQEARPAAMTQTPQWGPPKWIAVRVGTGE
jgi:serine protease Do